MWLAQHRDADTGAAWITHRYWPAIVVDSRFEHVAQLVLVLRCHHDHVRQAAEIGKVEHTVMGTAILTGEAGAVHREDDRQVLDANVMNDLVVGTLEEGRVDGGDGPHSLSCQPGGEGHRVLLGDTDVEKAFGM